MKVLNNFILTSILSLTCLFSSSPVRADGWSPLLIKLLKTMGAPLANHAARVSQRYTPSGRFGNSAIAQYPIYPPMRTSQRDPTSFFPFIPNRKFSQSTRPNWGPSETPFSPLGPYNALKDSPFAEITLATPKSPNAQNGDVSSEKNKIAPLAQPFEKIYPIDQWPAQKVEKFHQLVERYDRILIGILDSGIDYNHPSLAYKIPRQKHQMGTFRDGRTLPFDRTGHGTQVAQIAVQGSEDIALIPLHSSNPFQMGNEIGYAISMGARIINISFKISPFGQGFENRISDLSQMIEDNPDVLFVVAAGNEGSNNDEIPEYPGSLTFPNLVSVASVTSTKELDPTSNYGVGTTQIAAVGNSVLVIENDRTFQRVSGTSFAAPQVANLCARMLAIHPQLTVEEIVTILKASVDPTENLTEKVKWGGVLNKDRALALTKKLRSS